MTEKKRKYREMPSVPAENLTIVVNRMGYAELARKTGYSESHLANMVNDNKARPIVEDWARLFLKDNNQIETVPSKVFVICKVEKEQVEHLSKYVTKMLNGKATHFIDEDEK